MSKRIKASEYYSRRVKDENSEDTKSIKDIQINLDSSDTQTLGKIKISGNYSQSIKSNEGHRTIQGSMTGERIANAYLNKIDNEKSVKLGSVKDDVREAANKEDDEAKELTKRIIGAEGIAEVERDILETTGKIIQKTVHTTRYTVTRFLDEEKRKRYEEYKNTSKELKKKENEVEIKDKKTDKEIQNTGISSRYSTTVNRKKYLEKNNEKKKSGIAQRHTRSVKKIKGQALNNITDAEKTLIKMPNRYVLMITDDLESEGLIKNVSASIVSNVIKRFNSMIKLFMSTLKNIMIVLSPLLFCCVFIMFMIYIVFLSDFSSYFDIDKDSTLISSKETTYNLETLINESLVNRREEMAKEIVESDENSQVYFVNIEEFVINDVRTSVNKKAEEEGIIPVLFNEWVASDAGREFIKNLAYNMCYTLTDEEAALYTEDKLIEYSGNIKLNTSPGIGILPGLGSGLEIGINKKNIIIGYHLITEK